MIIGYARVSTEEQSMQTQVEQLKAAGCDRIIEETGSGKSLDDRDGLRAIMLLVGAGDTVVVTKLDRLARSTIDMLRLVELFTQRGAGMRSLGEGWADTTTPA